MNTCQHCGTELSNPRAKNCAKCTNLKAEAHKAGYYGVVVTAIEKARRSGLTGQAVRDAAEAAWKAESRARYEAQEQRRQAERAAEQAKQRRDARIAELKAQGWTFYRVDEESMDHLGALGDRLENVVDEIFPGHIRVSADWILIPPAVEAVK